MTNEDLKSGMLTSRVLNSTTMAIVILYAARILVGIPGGRALRESSPESIVYTINDKFDQKSLFNNGGKQTKRSFRLIESYILSRVDRSKCQHPHPGLIIASHTFKEPYFAFSDFDQLSLAIMDLLLRGAYPGFELR